MKQAYAVVFEQAPNNYCAYVPDLPGCISVGDTWEEMQAMIREAIAFHIEGMVEHGEPFPKPAMSVEQALAHHNEAVSELDEETLALFADSGPDLPPIVQMVEVEVSLPRAAKSA